VLRAQKTATQLHRHSEKTKQLCSQETEQAGLLKSCTAQWSSSFLCVIFIVFCIFFFSLVLMTRKADESTNFVFVQLIYQQLGFMIRATLRDKVKLAWERISHEMKVPDIFWLKLIIKSQ
jgi:hypothetical protein